MFITMPGVAVSGATNFRIMFSTYILQGSFLIAVTLFQSLGKANKATWLVLFRQIILFIPLCIVLPMVGGMGIRGVWLAIALTDAILVVITVLISDGKKETQYIVKDIGLPTGIEKRLEALGMTRGTSVTVLNSKSKGILIVKVRGTRFALGRNITEHISVAM